MAASNGEIYAFETTYGPSATPPTITIIKDVRLFDGKDVHPSASVAFSPVTGKILDVYTSSSSDIIPQPGMTVIDGRGHTLLPGLIEAHVHVYDLHLPPGEDHGQVLRSPLKCGVTTICDMHSDLNTIHTFKAQIKAEAEGARKGRNGGRVELTDLKSSLYGATIEGGWPKPIVLAHNPSEELIAKVAKWPSLTPETAPDFIASHKSNGADYIKLMQENCCSLALPTNSVPVASQALQTAVVKAAHDADLCVVGHATAWESTEIVLRAGADGLTHTFIDKPPSNEMLPLFRQNNAFVIPTLTVLSSLTNQLQDLRTRFADIAFDKLGVVDAFTRQNMVEFLGMNAKSAIIENGIETIRWYIANNVDVVAGTDSSPGLKGTATGPSLWMELELYVERCGMSVLDALRSATEVSARRLGFIDRGTVEVGKRADLLLVKGNPTERIADLWGGEERTGVVGVWKEGLRGV